MKQQQKRRKRILETLKALFRNETGSNLTQFYFVCFFPFYYFYLAHFVFSWTSFFVFNLKCLDFFELLTFYIFFCSFCLFSHFVRVSGVVLDLHNKLRWYKKGISNAQILARTI